MLFEDVHQLMNQCSPSYVYLGCMKSNMLACNRCDICKERYRVRRAPFSGAKIPLGGRLPTFDEFKEVFFSLLGSPVWQVGIDVSIFTLHQSA